MQVFNSFQEMQAGATAGGRPQSAMSVFNAKAAIDKADEKEDEDEREARLNPRDYGESGGDYGRYDVETYWDRRY